MNITKTKDKVLTLLEKDKRYRDNDNILVATIWNKEAVQMELKSTYNFLKAYSEGKISSSESITRCRRKLQELNPKLRGKNYIKRQEEQSNVINQLNQFK